MKVSVEQLKEEAFILEEDIPASSWSIDNFDVKFIDNIHLKCKFRRYSKEILVDAAVSIRREIKCSRCLETARQDIEKQCQLSYSVDNLGQYLDVNEDIREEVLLDYPMKFLCGPECKGICFGCGVNLNIEKCKCE